MLSNIPWNISVSISKINFMSSEDKTLTLEWKQTIWMHSCQLLQTFSNYYKLLVIIMNF